MESEGPAVEGAWRDLGRTWTLRIVRILDARGEVSFGELRRELGVSSKVLSERLAMLEERGVLVRHRLPHNGRGRVTCELTARGRVLARITERFAVWLRSFDGARAIASG